jgi:uncharacterized cupin superfamily protein
VPQQSRAADAARLFCARRLSYDAGMDKHKLRGPALDPAEVEAHRGTNYPEPFRARVAGRAKQRLGDALGLRHFGVNLTTIGPGGQSALRHWHRVQDEFIYVLSGELVLVTNGGEQVLTEGMAAGFPGGTADAHHLVNRSGRDATYLEVGDRMAGDSATYPDDDLEARMGEGRWMFFKKDGTPY